MQQSPDCIARDLLDGYCITDSVDHADDWLKTAKPGLHMVWLRPWRIEDDGGVEIETSLQLQAFPEVDG